MSLSVNALYGGMKVNKCMQSMLTSVPSSYLLSGATIVTKGCV